MISLNLEKQVVQSSKTMSTTILTNILGTLPVHNHLPRETSQKCAETSSAVEYALATLCRTLHECVVDVIDLIKTAEHAPWIAHYSDTVETPHKPSMSCEHLGHVMRQVAVLPAKPGCIFGMQSSVQRPVSAEFRLTCHLLMVSSLISFSLSPSSSSLLGLYGSSCCLRSGPISLSCSAV